MSEVLGWVLLATAVVFTVRCCEAGTAKREEKATLYRETCLYDGGTAEECERLFTVP